MAEEKKDAVEKVERLPGQVVAQMLAGQETMFFNVALFEHAQRVATMLSDSSMVPEHFRKNIGNCLIALNLAQRMGLDPFMLMQSIYVVHGRPGIEGKLVIALLEGHGRFGPLHFKYEGQGETEKKVKRPESCQAYAVDKKTNETVYGPVVTWAMVVAEGWNKPKGQNEFPSKWETLPELMFTYRAASFFGRVHDPGALMGFRSADELEDMPEEVNVTPTPPEDRAAAEEKARVEQEKAKQDAIAKFKASIPAGGIVNDVIKAEIMEFLDQTAKAHRCSSEDIMVKAAETPEKFWTAFDKWSKKQKETTEKEKKKNGEGEGKKQPPTEEKAATQPSASSGAEEKNPPPPGTEPQKPKKSPMDLVKELFQTDPQMYYKAAKRIKAEAVRTDETAQKVLDEAEKIRAEMLK